MAVDTLGHLLALHVTPANEQERDQVGVLAKAVQEVTGENVQLGFVDQGYTGEGGRAGGGRTRHRVGGRQAGRSQERLRAAAPQMGGRTHLWLDRPLPPPGTRLRAAAYHPGGPHLGLLRGTAPCSLSPLNSCQFITSSKMVASIIGAIILAPARKYGQFYPKVINDLSNFFGIEG